MAEIRFLEPSRFDLRIMRAYGLEAFGGKAADAYMRGLAAVLVRLSEHPRIGVARDDLRPGTRSFPYRRHRVYYRVDEEGIVIQRILHHAQMVRDDLFP